MSQSRNVLLQGIRVWDVYERVDDPDDKLHVNSVTGNSMTDLTLRDSYIVGRNKFMASKGLHNGLVIENVWSTQAPGTGFQFIAMDGDNVFGARRNVRSWNHNGAAKDRLDIIDGKQQSQYNANPDRLNVRDSSISLSAPGGGADPAMQWRAQNPYNSWARYFGWA
jgi:hypothetical protein